jgi:hypothetical protein
METLSLMKVAKNVPGLLTAERNSTGASLVPAPGIVSAHLLSSGL